LSSMTIFNLLRIKAEITGCRRPNGAGPVTRTAISAKQTEFPRSSCSRLAAVF
jgi:hypothetical protein